MNELLLIVAKEMESAAPGEFQILPYGEVSIEGEPPAIVDEAAMAGIVAAFERRGNDMVVDYEHQTLKDVQAPAAGWIKRLINKGKDGLWAVVEWTDKAKGYLTSREYRYFSPVMWVAKQGRRVVRLENAALTNYPRINNLKPIIAKMGVNNHETPNKEEIMNAELLKLLGLAEGATEDNIVEAVRALAARAKGMEEKEVAAKAVMAALDLPETADQAQVIAKIDAIKAPGNVAVELSQQVAELTRTINGMKRDDLVALALKDGKTSPDELEKWGKDLAEKNPEQFEKIVLSRSKGSVIPIGDPPGSGKEKAAAADEATLTVAKLMGNTEEDLKKYGG
jgi:phage I-like protein